MNYLANRFYMGHGKGFGKTRLASFDNALLDSGVGNYNLVRLSSILPVQALDIQMSRIDLPLGSLLPIAYAEITTNDADDPAVAAIAIGVPKDKTKCCVIMEYEALGKTEPEALEIVKNMVKEAFHNRGWELDHIMETCASAHPERSGDYATAFACVAEWE